MDIQRQLSGKSTLRKMNKYYYFILLAIIPIAAWAIKSHFLGDASYIVKESSIQTAVVEKGKFNVEIRGIGVLKPDIMRWESAQVSGRVEQVLVKPGSVVAKGQTLLTLFNPSLVRQLKHAEWEVKATKAEHHAALVALESQLLELETSVIQAQFNYQAIKLKLDAERNLIAQRKGSISAIEFKRTELELKQQHHRWQAQQKRLVKMQTNLTAIQQAHHAKLGLVTNNYQQIQDEVAALTVVATNAGVVQQVSLNLGEQVHQGDAVALIANQNKLIAELDVQELQVQHIQRGQKVWIDTRQSQVLGEVARIDPAVINGMVKIDVKMVDDLPSEARPDLNVEGRIIISEFEQTTFVKRPAFSPRLSEAFVYRISPDGQLATKTNVTFGQRSVNYIQIEAGLNQGERIVISNTDEWLTHEHVLIN
ncbi:efflux RND transporter periplasmic adaptor subunit [Flocculibacter collagenilyticus]|uniref:efflux RND transporter periplasmic adaptor subunit n=1 Tax=Flocculibacter collagenilyticus TaxID=2744479 RepID=UPI0018F50373|nr:HlyD family efflux transporter periplasmic adaptor subunit [Flocculibacter collagenilyticus]